MSFKYSPSQVLVVLPADAMCSDVLTGWNPTKGICMEQRRPMMKKVLYAT